MFKVESVNITKDRVRHVVIFPATYYGEAKLSEAQAEADRLNALLENAEAQAAELADTQQKLADTLCVLNAVLEDAEAQADQLAKLSAMVASQAYLERGDAITRHEDEVRGLREELAQLKATLGGMTCLRCGREYPVNDRAVMLTHLKECDKNPEAEVARLREIALTFRADVLAYQDLTEIEEAVDKFDKALAQEVDHG